MAQKGLKKGYAIDLLIIGLSWIVFYGIAGICYVLLKIDFSGMPLLLQTLFGAMIEFGVMGFGVTLVCFIRGESFASFGLKKEKLLTTVFLSALVCLPSYLFLVFKNTSQLVKKDTVRRLYWYTQRG